MLAEGVTLQEGTLRAAPAALNYGGDAVVSTLAGGTLELTGSGAATPHFNVTGDIQVKATGSGSSLSAPSATAGSLNKRGADPFTLVVDRDREIQAALNVYEGALRIEGDGVHQLTKVGALTVYANGLSSADAPDAALVINDVKGLTSTGNLRLGSSCSGDYSSAAPSVAVTNSSVSVVNVFVGDANSDASMRPVATFSNSTLRVTGYDGFLPGGYGTPAGVLAKWSFTDSRLEVVHSSLGFRVAQTPYEMTFDHSTLCCYNNDEEASIDMSLAGGWYTAHGEFVFKRGSRLCCKSIRYTTGTAGTFTNPRFDLTFDDSEWFVDDADAEVPSKNMNVNITATGETGIIFAPPADRTWTLYTTVTGTGGFTKRGAGTLSVVAAKKYSQLLEDARTIQCTGALRVEGGLLQIADGAIDNITGRDVVLANDGVLDYGGMTLAEAVVTTGGGTIRNAALTRPRFVVGFDGEGAALPVGLDYANGLTMSGRVVFDFGAEAGTIPWAKGTVMTVARWTGAQKPDVSRWRAENVGNGCSCIFTANNDGTVSATVIGKPGFMLIYR